MINGRDPSREPPFQMHFKALKYVCLGSSRIVNSKYDALNTQHFDNSDPVDKSVSLIDVSAMSQAGLIAIELWVFWITGLLKYGATFE